MDISANMDQKKMFQLAQEKKLKKANEQMGQDGSSGTVLKPKNITAGTSSGSGRGASVQGGSVAEVQPMKRQKQGDKGEGFHVADEEDMGGPLVDLTGSLPEGGVRGSEVGGKAIGISTASEAVGTERCTLLKFHSGPGWLGEGSGIPLEALGAFALSPDKKKLEGTNDDDLYQHTKETLGKLGTYVLEVLERAEKNKERAQWELGQAVTERSAKDVALKKVKEATKREESLTKDLSARDEELRSVKAQLLEMKESLETEKASFASLQIETDRLREEGRKAAETLEKVEREALITYEDCVKKFQASPEFEEILYEKAGTLHEGGYEDCLRFVGVGNVVNSEEHSIDKFREAELREPEPKGPETGIGDSGSGTKEVEEPPKDGSVAHP